MLSLQIQYCISFLKVAYAMIFAFFLEDISLSLLCFCICFQSFFVLILYLLQSSAVWGFSFVKIVFICCNDITFPDWSTGSKKHLNYNVNSPYSVIICLFNLMLHVVSNCVITCFFLCTTRMIFVLFCRNYEGSSDLKVCNWGATCHPGFEHVKCSELLKCWLDQM